MSFRSTVWYLSVAASMLAAGAALAWVPQFFVNDPIEECALSNEHVTGKIDCWFLVIKDAFMEDGTQAAFATFERVYREYDTFANTGCHRHAHRVGDLSYYFDYLTHQDLARTEFPQNANACGYGFYHGFFEHLVQDNPEPAFVDETCAYLKTRLSATAPAISQTCYHGSGHGFVLARADDLIDPSSWSVASFIEEPLTKCESLQQATDYERAECRQGVYNVLVDWMEGGEYGLSYDYEDPFVLCDSERYDRQPDCYYEMAQKVDAIAKHDPLQVIAIAQEAARGDLAGTILGVSVAGMIQHDPRGTQERILAACREIEGELGDLCLESIVGGLIEHDTEQGDYLAAFTFCGQSGLADAERTVCYRGLNTNIRRYRTEEELQARCAQGAFPGEFCALLSSTSST